MINLFYAGNDYVFDGVLISLLSIAKHTKSPLNVYIATTNLLKYKESYKPFSEEHAKILQEVLKKVNNESKLTIINMDKFNEEIMSSRNANSQYTPYAFLRLYIDEFDEIPDKLLYLDYDTVACKDISLLYDIDISKYEFAGALDYYGKVFIKPNYINSGVLLLNMKKIKETNLLKKARKLCAKKRMLFPDQSALNKAVKRKLILPAKYNSQKRLNKDTVIRHFSKTIKFFPYVHTLNIKPWHIEKLHTKYKCHEFDDILEQYKSVKKSMSN